MRFVYHHRTTGRGAEGNHIMAVVKPLEADGHVVSIVSPPGVDPRKTAGQVPLDKGATRQRGISRVWQWISKQAPQVVFEVLELAYNAYAAVRVSVTIRRERPDAYYERYAFFLFMGVFTAKLLGVPVFLEVNEIAGIKRARRQILVPVAVWIERVIFRRADAIFVVSSFLRDEVLRRGARPNTVHLMPNGIDRHRFDLNGSRGKVRRERGLGESVVAGFVGWFDEWDRLDVLVDAVAEVGKTNGSLRLMLVGDGPVTRELRDRIAERRLNDRVILTGAVGRDQVPQYIDAMDICVLPHSNPYGSPMALFEFMALGKAIIAPDLAPIRDVVTDGENGIIVPPADVEQIAANLRRLIDDPVLRLELGARSRKYVLTQRTWEANASRIAALAAQSRVRKDCLSK